MSWIRRSLCAGVVALFATTLAGCSPYYGSMVEEYEDPYYYEDYEADYEQVSPPEPEYEDPYAGGIAWNQAVDYAWTYQRVCGPFAGWGNSYDDVFFNLGADYPNPSRFQIVIWDIGWIEPIPNPGSTVCVTGEISMYEGVAQIQLYDPGAIELYW